MSIMPCSVAWLASGPARTRIALEIGNTFIPGPVAVYNTVGEIRGSEKPDEYVIVGAHLDSWDLAQGTTDNGTGSSVVLETARILAQAASSRTAPSASYCSPARSRACTAPRHTSSGTRTKPRTSLAWSTTPERDEWSAWDCKERKAMKPVLQAELVSLKQLGFKGVNLRSMGGSDHVSFEPVGVPGFAMRQDLGEYRFTHHSQSDTLDKAKEPELVQGAEVLAIAALHVANLPEMLPRDKPVPQPGQRGNRGERPGRYGEGKAPPAKTAGGEKVTSSP